MNWRIPSALVAPSLAKPMSVYNLDFAVSAGVDGTYVLCPSSLVWYYDQPYTAVASPCSSFFLPSSRRNHTIRVSLRIQVTVCRAQVALYYYDATTTKSSTCVHYRTVILLWHFLQHESGVVYIRGQTDREEQQYWVTSLFDLTFAEPIRWPVRSKYILRPKFSWTLV